MLEAQEDRAATSIIEGLMLDVEPTNHELNHHIDDGAPQVLYRDLDQSNFGVNPFSEDDDSEYDGRMFNEAESYEERTLREQKQWQEKTFQWGHTDLWDYDWKEPCHCTGTMVRTPKKIVVFDILYRKQIMVNFCACQSDAVRLVKMGLIGGTAKYPCTAFSIRLIRFYQLLWKWCSNTIAPFCQAVDEFLDAFNTLILVPSGNQPREWRKRFSCAVDVYREMIRREAELETLALKLSAIEKLASNCPRCFGPAVQGKRPAEPDVIVSLDGNFQHRRHMAASAGWRPESTITPSLFLTSKYVNKWEEKIGVRRNDVKDKTEELVHPCSERHTAADDVRGAQTWSGCDETGLFGMACRHDHVLKFINIVQSGERGHFPVATINWMFKQLEEANGDQQKLAVLYDIGCNLTKALRKRRAGELKIGTGAWHSYAHERSCQILYNPRLNEDWGMSDGEGLERICIDYAA
ncbi:uncharacterized protein MELLADRAFT_87955 [Melampsora larici-populina 98AG31]|uniref:CxC1-like cysteine cluster associated with KDZ transposases domain-containing protein n=1 Tax=Melampsora larici-populina (strain 98AG31 / pathotype 3-4-7) TaxID=747676 RepID=F4RQI7_MELLP|nr:uncharacterized protein MELLADRAFT_87955 [Melampsora larici-populina 98AG31]EGG05304.1 hypothetical protein MELLADRAFT_87955 [Melampsora larici-populina 98AG31]